jgi:two-component system, LytTR family, response regulator
MPIRSLIVDDEPLARERVGSFLAAEADFEVAGECGSGKDALALLRREKVDLIFLDIVMPEMNGFELARALPPPHIPHIVFVTVFDTFALEAFEVHAVDYLLKPVDPERFKKALNHVRARWHDREFSASWSERIAGLLRDLSAPRACPERISLKVDGEIVFFDPTAIRWLESAGNYVTVHLGGSHKLIRDTLSSLEGRLARFGFVRISRSAIVNISEIGAIKPCGFGEYSVRLLDNTELTLSRSYREAFFRRVNGC